MATLRKRNGLFQVQIRLKGFQPESRSFTTRSHAKTWGKEREAEIRGGRLSGKGHCFATLIPLYPCSAVTKATLTTFSKRCTFLDVPLSQITGAHWRAYRKECLKTQKPGSFNRGLKGPRGVIKWAIGELGLTKDLLLPLEDIPISTKVVKRTRRLHSHEEALLRAKLSPNLNAALTILLETAMRVGEVSQLKKEWIVSGLIYLPGEVTKTKKPRTIALSPRALEAVKIYEPTKYLKVGLRKVIKKVGLVDFHVHDCRHEALSRWADSGLFSAIEMMNQSGHQSLAELQTYLHATPSLIQRKLVMLAQQSLSLKPQGEHSPCSDHPHGSSSDLPLLGVQPIPLLVD